eukprot:g7051.t1
MPAVVGSLEPKEVEGQIDTEYMGSYIWIIPNYSSYSSKRLVHSPTFEKGGETWRMWLFPNGSTHATEGDMSLFLHYIKEDDVFAVAPVEHPCAKFSIKIIDQLQGDGIQHQINYFHNFGESNGEWGWKDFAQISRLTEEDSGLLVDDTMKVELNLFVRSNAVEPPESDAQNEAIHTIEFRVLTDKKLRTVFNQSGTVSGLASFEDCKSYCICDQLRMSNFVELISRDLKLSKDQLRFWLCEQQPSNQLRIIKNLSNKNLKIQRISDLVTLSNNYVGRVGKSSVSHSIDIYVETPMPGQEDLPTIDNEEDWIAFLKHYDPWKQELKFIGTIPLRNNCTPVELMVDARMHTGMKTASDVSLFIERPVSSFLIHQVKSDDVLDAVGLRPGGILIVQPKVDSAYAKGKEMKHPTAASFLEEVILQEMQGMAQVSFSEDAIVQPHDDDMCVVCFSRPRTVGFLHGKSLHRCVCQECATHIQKQENPCCPLCRLKIDLVIENIF